MARKKRCIGLILLVVGLPSVAFGQDGPLALNLGFPATAFDGGGAPSFTSYDAGGQAFTVQALASAVKCSDFDNSLFFPDFGDLNISIGVDNGGILTGFAVDDLILTGDLVDFSGGNCVAGSGILLTAGIIEFGAQDVGATDFFDMIVEVTGGALADPLDPDRRFDVGQEIGVQLESPNSNFIGVFTQDFGGGAKGTFGPLLPDGGNGGGGGGEGCTPGYWKQEQHFDSWIGFVPVDPGATLFVTVFGTNCGGVLSGTLLDALEQGGGGAAALGRHAVAALLNAASPDVASAFTEAEIINMVQAACAAGGDIEGTKDLFEAENEAGCPLD